MKANRLRKTKTPASPRGPPVSSPPGVPGLGVDDDLDAAVGLFLEHLVGVGAVFQLDLVGDQEAGVDLALPVPSPIGSTKDRMRSEEGWPAGPDEGQTVQSA